MYYLIHLLFLLETSAIVVNRTAAAMGRSHCSVVVEIWKELGGDTPLEPQTVGADQCCHYKQSKIPGIICSMMNFVVEIVWPNSRLAGGIPSVISNLVYLRNLVLFNNKISLIPTEIGFLTSLEILDLSGNQLSELPDQVGFLSDLNILNLSNNNFSSLGSWIGYFGDLEWLLLQNNQLNCEIPSEIWNLKNLQYLDLSKNRFYGTISNQIENLQLLKDLYLNDNLLSGDIPLSIQSMEALRDIRLAANNFSNTDALNSGLPSEIGCSSTVLNCRRKRLFNFGRNQ